MAKATNELLRKARIERGFETAAEAARCFGWVESTYTSHENGVRPITRQAARRYAAAFGIDPAALLGFNPGGGVASSVKVKGEAALGTWRDSRVDKNCTMTDLTLPAPAVGKDGVVRYAIKIADQHANKVANDGDFVICEPLSSDEIEVDRLYYVQRTNGDLVEKTIRRVVPTKAGLQLSTVTNTPTLVNSIPYPNEGVTVLALVVGKYVPL